MKRPRIVFVAPRAPFPLNSGMKMRVSHLARALTQIGDVDLVAYGTPSDFRQFPSRLADGPAWWSSLHSLQLVPDVDWKESDLATYRKRVGRRMLGREGLLYKTFPVEPLKRRLGRLAAEADLVWAEHLYTALGLVEHAGKIIVDINDLESAKTGRQVGIESSSYMRWAFRREASRLARDERAAVRRFARVAVCSTNDEALLREADRERVWVLPNGVDDALFDLPDVPRDSRRLVFVGTMAYEPNQDAIQYFCREILPRITARVPDVTLDIVGLVPPNSILALHDGRRVYVHPDVPAVEPFVQRAALSIVPLRVGGGTRLKILESLALGTPVVSTTVGAEGLELVAGEHLLLADTAESFADAVIHSLCEPEYSERLAMAGRRLTKELYLWSAIRDRVAMLAEGWLASRAS